MLHSISTLKQLRDCQVLQFYALQIWSVIFSQPLYNRLQSVLNAAGRSIAGLRRSDHITDTLASFHWLQAPERVQYKLATIVYRSLNGMAPHYLAADLRRLSGMPSR